MNLDKAEQFLKDKGLDTEKYRIKDVNGGYLPQIPIALWLTEFAEQVKNNDLLHSVSEPLIIGCLTAHPIDKDGCFEIEMYEEYTYLTTEETKKLIDYLTKSINAR